MNLFEILITQPILNLLLSIYQLFGDFGFSIVIFAVVVKFALWPITKNNLVQSKKIRDLQPKIAEIKKKANGNRNLELIQTMALYRENGIKQGRMILSSFLTVIIFITLYSTVNIVVQRTQISKFAYAPVAEFPRVKELTSNQEFKPKLFGVIHLSEKAYPFDSRSSIFLFAAAMFSSWVQYYLMKQMNAGKNSRKFSEIMKEAADGKEADQAELNAIVSKNMSAFLPIMMFFMMVNLPGPLNFYYFVSNFIQLIQNKIISNQKEKTSTKEKSAKEAKIVEKTTSSGSKVRRIKAKDNRRK